MRKFFRVVWFSATFCAVTAGTLCADEALRRTQQSLRDQGFYYGPVDGSPGDETNQAVRRYQIRNGLSVSGQLDEETKRSIEKSGDAVPPTANGGGGTGSVNHTTPGRATPAPNRAAPSPSYQRPTVRPVPQENSQDRQRDEDEAPEPTPRSPRSETRPDLRVGPGPLPPANGSGEMPRNAVLPSARLSALFAGTPYEFAPPPVQSDILKRAQAKLTREGFYDGAINGVPGLLIAEALTNYQGVNRLRKTGRLDVSTLGGMRLLPGRQALVPRGRDEEERDEDNAPRRKPNIIFEGRIAR